MNDAVDRLIIERAALDRGFPRGLAISFAVHGLVAGVAFAASLLPPKKPRLNIVPAFAVQLPRGGGGSPSPSNPAPAPQPPKPQPEATAPPAPKPAKPTVEKPPKDEPKKALPVETKARRQPTKATPAPVRAASGAPGGTGTSSQTPGLQFGPPGPGAPGGSDMYGDYYMASVQGKIWRAWNQQIKSGMTQSVTIRFTILADGSVEGVEVLESSGAYLLDNAAKRAVMISAPFNPLPSHYATNRVPVQAVFTPTP